MDVAQAVVQTVRGSHLLFGKHVSLLDAAEAPREASREDNVCLLPWPCSLFRTSSLLATCRRYKHPGPVRFWLLLLCACMNFLFLGAQLHKVPASSPCRLQLDALENLASEVDSFIGDLDDLFTEADWETMMKATAVSYTGEEVYPAEPLDPARLGDTFPAPKYGGAVAMMDVVDAPLRCALQDPKSLILPEEEWGPLPEVTPKVWADDKTWGEVVRLLLRSRISQVVPDGTQARLNGRVIEHGVFAVGKPGSPLGKGPQRFVVNMPLINIMLREIVGDMALLPMTNSWHMIFLENGQVVLLSSEDMKCAFYLFSLPESWLPYLCFSKKVSRRHAGLEGPPDELVVIALRVVPMGWNSATGLIQHAHRQLCKIAGLPSACEIRRDRPLRQYWVERKGRETRESFRNDSLYFLWQIYLDNLDTLEIVSESELRTWIFTTSRYVTDMRSVYEQHGVQRSESKAVARDQSGKMLGTQLFDGRRLRCPGSAMLPLIQLTLYSFVRPQCTKRWMQELAGRWVRHQQVETTTACSFSALWSSLGHWPRSQSIPDSIVEKLLCCIALLPKMAVDLTVPCSSVVTCSDASLSGGAVCSTTGATPSGVEAVSRWLGAGITTGDEEAGLLAVFDGIGGARRAFELMGCGLAVYLSSEADIPAMRVVQYAWPSRIDAGPIKGITGSKVASLLQPFPRLRVLYVIGGFPCKGFSSANPDARGLANQQSIFLFELVRLLRELEVEMGPLQIKVRFMAECVATMKNEDRVACTRLLGVAPIVMDAGTVSHARRDRLFWCNFASEVTWHCATEVWHDVLRLVPTEGPGPVSRWKGAQVAWPRRSGLDRFATFLRARPKPKEPPLFLANGRDRRRDCSSPHLASVTVESCADPCRESRDASDPDSMRGRL